MQCSRRTLIFFTSKKSEDANDLVQRSFILWQSMPEFLRLAHPVELSYGRLRFFRPGQKEGLPVSEIRAIPSGGDVLRMHVASGIWCDEFGFQVGQRATLSAAMPTVQGGGRIDIVSSAEPGILEEMAPFSPAWPSKRARD